MIVEIWTRVAASLILVLVSLREFLFVPGYYVYADQFWSISPTLQNSQAFTPLVFTSGRISAAYFPQFTRDIISWPSLLFIQYSPNYEAAIRGFVFYTFLLFVFASWLLGYLVITAIERETGRRFSAVTHWLLQFFVVVLAYSNFLSIQLNADGGTLADGLILLMISAMVLLTSVRTRRRDSVLVAVLLSISLLLDPDYYLIAIVAILAAAFVAALVTRDYRERFKGLVTSIGLSLPVLAFVFVGLLVTGPPGTLSSVRPVAQAYSLSRNLDFWTAIQLSGYSWSTVTLGPPSILGTGAGIASIPVFGSPANILVPSGGITTVWLLSTSVLPLLSFASVLFSRRIPRVILPAAGVLVVGLGFTLYALIPGFSGALQGLANLPVVGPALGTSLAIPDHFLSAVVASYLILAPATLVSLTSRTLTSQPAHVAEKTARNLPGPLCKLRRLNPIAKPLGQPLFIVAVTAIVLFAGWQSVDGSFFPARADNSTFAGNGVPDVGAFTPIPVSNYTIQTYDFLFSHGSSFNVYWPVGDGVDLSSFHIDIPSVDLPDFRTLMASGFEVDLAPYLAAHGVRYVVVQNLNDSAKQYYIPSIIPAQYHSNLYLYYFGLPNYSTVLSFLLRAPGMELGFAVPGIEVFQVTSFAGLTYNASLLLDASTNQYLAASAYGLFGLAGTSVAMTDPGGPGLPISYGAQGQGAEVLTPENLSESYARNPAFPVAPLTTSLANDSSGVRYTANSTTLPDEPTWYQDQSQGQYNRIFNSFYFTNWAGNFSANVTNGNISVHSAHGATFTLDFGGPVTFSSRGVAPSGDSRLFDAEFAASVSLSDPSDSEVNATFVAENASNETTLAFEQYAPRGGPTSEQFSSVEPIPNGTQYFTFRLGGDFTGFLNISYYNLSVLVSPALPSARFPLGSYLGSENASVALPSPSGFVTVLASGTGSINGMQVDEAVPTESLVYLGHAAALNTTGAVEIAAVLLSPRGPIEASEGYYVVYNGARTSGVLLRQDGTDIAPIATNYGTNLYVLPSPGPFTFVTPAVTVLQFAYVALVGYVVAMAAVGLGLLTMKVPRRLLGRVRSD